MPHCACCEGEAFCIELVPFQQPQRRKRNRRNHPAASKGEPFIRAGDTEYCS